MTPLTLECDRSFWEKYSDNVTKRNAFKKFYPEHEELFPQAINDFGISNVHMQRFDFG